MPQVAVYIVTPPPNITPGVSGTVWGLIPAFMFWHQPHCIFPSGTTAELTHHRVPQRSPKVLLSGLRGQWATFTNELEHGQGVVSVRWDTPLTALLGRIAATAPYVVCVH